MDAERSEADTATATRGFTEVAVAAEGRGGVFEIASPPAAARNDAGT